jgi:hypothetical protein
MLMIDLILFIFTVDTSFRRPHSSRSKRFILQKLHCASLRPVLLNQQTEKIKPGAEKEHGFNALDGHGVTLNPTRENANGKFVPILWLLRAIPEFPPYFFTRARRFF